MGEIFCNYIRTDNITFKYANGKSAESGKEFHTFNEIILFLKGDATLITDSIRMELKPDTVVLIPKETYHQVIINRNQENYCRCVLNFSDNCILNNEAFSAAKVLNLTDEAKLLFEILQKKSKEEAGLQTARILESALTLILDLLDEKQAAVFENRSNQFIKRVVKIIDENLNAPLSSEGLAKKLNVSVSALQHTFKKEMEIPLYKYILKRRLISARQQILKGIPSTEAASNLGFNDYSGFYKQYKNMFGVSPKNTKTSQ